MLISSWAEQNSSGHGTGNHAKLAGLIYVDRINKPRFGASAKSAIGLIERICGSDNFSHLVLVTTHWDAESAGKAMEREHDLKTKKEFWGDLVAKVLHLKDPECPNIITN